VVNRLFRAKEQPTQHERDRDFAPIEELLTPAIPVLVLLSGESLLEAARTHVTWGLLYRDRGDLAPAQGHFLEAAAQFEASGLKGELGNRAALPGPDGAELTLLKGYQHG
jgi:hypothetical protein